MELINLGSCSFYCQTLSCGPSLFLLHLQKCVFYNTCCELYKKYICSSQINFILKVRLLAVNKTRYEIAQAYTHTQRHINIAWSEMVSFLFVLFLLFFLFSLAYTNNMGFILSLLDKHCDLITLLSLITFLLTTSNLMLYFL
jgi:nitrate reductase NapE component